MKFVILETLKKALSRLIFKKFYKNLIIKLGAIGDVIRTTPLLEKFKSEYGLCHFSW